MKVFVYSYRDFDEAEPFTRYSRELGIDLGICRAAPDPENARLAEGYEYISVITSPVDRKLLQRFHSMGVKLVSTRTIGYDHVDVEAARELGLHISNATYSPNSVAEYTVMLLLMLTRKMKRIMQRANIQDFSLPGIQGKEMPSYTVGVLGTGRIGQTVLRMLAGFGCRLLAYDRNPCEEAEKYAEYVSLDELYAQSDILTLHLPVDSSNFHMIDREAFEKMRDGVLIVNTARGSLIDSQALIAALEQGKVAGAALDVIEGEIGLYYHDRKSVPLQNREMAIFRSFPNVIVSHHMAWYTDEAVNQMVYSSLKSCRLVHDGLENPWEVC